jgi:transposase
VEGRTGRVKNGDFDSKTQTNYSSSMGFVLLLSQGRPLPPYSLDLFSNCSDWNWIKRLLLRQQERWKKDLFKAIGHCWIFYKIE